MYGFPSRTTVLHSFATNDIKDIPITTRDVMISIDILRPSKFIAQRNKTRTQSNAENFNMNNVDIP